MYIITAGIYQRRHLQCSVAGVTTFYFTHIIYIIKFQYSTPSPFCLGSFFLSFLSSRECFYTERV
jgi:hypothetical protein